jgi:DNA-binding XRE family transcriptional regulator
VWFFKKINMQERQIKVKEIKLVVSQFRHLLPSETKYIRLFYYDKWQIKFIDTDQKDITSIVYSIVLPNQESLLDSIYGEIIESLDINKIKLLQDIEYIYEIEPSQRKEPILNCKTFFNVRKKGVYPAAQVAKDLSISTSTLYKIESNQYIDPGITVLIKHSIHFKKSILHFLRKDIGRKLLDIIVNELILREFISYETGTKIKEEYFNQ